jgi:hypothetical protein
MKQLLSVTLVLGCAAAALAQNNNTAPAPVVQRETTTVTTTTTTVADASYDLLGLETFNFLDATVLPEGMVDLRIAGRWVDTADEEDKEEQIIITPEIVWGATDRLEIAVSAPTWVDGEPDEGNYDTYLAATWRISDLDENCPAFALAGIMRIPTGDQSNGVDGQLRLIITNEYESGIRSHINLWATTVNTDNYEDARDFQYGGVAGLDGPLNDCGTLRWVFDYMYEASHQEGSEGSDTPAGFVPGRENRGEQRNTAEAGIQWQINECSKLGFAVQGGLDHAENETPEWAASLTYAHALSR